MKTMNAKRIAAVAAGAAMIGAAFAGAVSVDSGVGSYKFFSNDEPNVKIVVGSAAQASDAIAAANIAAMIGNLAYASSDITVVGKDTVTCPSTGGGSCTIDEATKSVTLDVTSPSGPVGAYKIRTMVEDNLDSSVVETNRSTITNYYGTLAATATTILPPTTESAKEVTGDLATGLLKKDSAITNPKGITLKQSETVYLFSKTQFDDPTDSVMGKYARAAYKVMFSNFLPYCVGDTNKANGTCADSDLTEKNHIQVYFLGDKWTIVDMSLDTSSPDYKINQVVLGKETAYNPIMQIGDELVAANGAKVKLKSISGIGYTTSYLPYASFEVIDPVSGASTTKTIQSGGNDNVAGVYIYVNKVFPGVNQVNYADVSIYSDRLDLSHNQQISGHGYWRSVLAQTPYSGSQTSPALAGIGIYDGSGLSANLKAGESYNLITNQPALSFTYSGLETVDLDPLTFVTDTSARPLGNGTNTNTPSAYWLQISSGRTDAFKNETLGITSNQVFVVLNSTDATYVPRGAAYAFDSTAGYYKRINPAAGAVRYYYSTTESANVSLLTMPAATGATIGGLAAQIILPEIIREAGWTTAEAIPSANADYGFFAMIWDPQLKQFVNQVNLSTIDTAYYNNSESPASLVSAKSVYYSPRGSKLGSVGTTTVQLNYATKLVYADYYLQAATTGTTTTGATRQVAKVGDTIDMGSGYSVKVVGIDCSAAGGGTCGTATGLDTLAPSEPKAMVVKALDTSASPLVITDANAGAYAQLIVVGGPAVNTVAKDALGDGAITSATEAMVKVVGSKVVVAGYSAADTQAAANALIKWLSDNRDAIVR